jgi:hypothetical protein
MAEISEYTVKSEDEVKPKMDRKEYMANYHKKNKEKITAKSMTKEKCKYCSREICHQELKKHHKTQYCRSRRMDTIDMLKTMKDHHRAMDLEQDEYYDNLLEYMIK